MNISRYINQFDGLIILSNEKGDTISLSQDEFANVTFNASQGKGVSVVGLPPAINNELIMLEFESIDAAKKFLSLIKTIQAQYKTQDKALLDRVVPFKVSFTTLIKKALFGVSYVLLAYVFVIGFSTILVDVLTPVDTRTVTTTASPCSGGCANDTNPSQMNNTTECNEEISQRILDLMSGQLQANTTSDAVTNILGSNSQSNTSLLSGGLLNYTCPE